MQVQKNTLTMNSSSSQKATKPVASLLKDKSVLNTSKGAFENNAGHLRCSIQKPQSFDFVGIAG